jgi:hypothetical protein
MRSEQTEHGGSIGCTSTQATRGGDVFFEGDGDRTLSNAFSKQHGRPQREVRIVCGRTGRHWATDRYRPACGGFQLNDVRQVDFL